MARTEPLHGFDLEVGLYWACHYPERPYSTEQVYDEDCPRCRIKAEADLHIAGDVCLYDPMEEPRRRKCMLSDFVNGDFNALVTA